MTFDEKTLRQLLYSPYGQSCALALLDAVETGQTVVITMIDGRTHTLTCRPSILEVLREAFGWKTEL